jgi:hypothetical protein
VSPSDGAMLAIFAIMALILTCVAVSVQKINSPHTKIHFVSVVVVFIGCFVMCLVYDITLFFLVFVVYQLKFADTQANIAKLRARVGELESKLKEQGK